jgi:hypothetical protein
MRTSVGVSFQLADGLDAGGERGVAAIIQLRESGCVANQTGPSRGEVGVIALQTKGCIAVGSPGPTLPPGTGQILYGTPWLIRP